MRFEFIRAEKAKYPVAVLCQVLQVSRSGFYAWTSRAPSKRARRSGELAGKVRQVHTESRGTYGSPRVHRELRRAGTVVSKKTIAKVMRAEGLVARRRRRYRATTDSRHTERVAPNLLKRDFTRNAPNEAWVTDVTAIWCATGWVYLAAILDLFSRRLVGWAISESNDTTLALSALQRALASRNPPRGLIHHSDRGSPYGSADYLAALRSRGIRPSMSRKGDCWDNAVSESFFASLKTERIGDKVYPDPVAATRDVADYIDHFYNSQRLHSTLDYVSPIEYELRHTLQHKAA